MIRKPVYAGALTLALMTHASAFDNGQWNDVDPHTREWFRSLKSPSGIPCCDTSDGKRTSWRASDKGYEVLIEDQWIPVPPEAVILRKDNPTGESIVWYGHQNGKPFIRCFVQGTEG